MADTLPDGFRLIATDGSLQAEPDATTENTRHRMQTMMDGRLALVADWTRKYGLPFVPPSADAPALDQDPSGAKGGHRMISLVLPWALLSCPPFRHRVTATPVPFCRRLTEASRIQAQEGSSILRRGRWQMTAAFLIWALVVLARLWFRRGWTMRWGGVGLVWLTLKLPLPAQADGWRDWFLPPISKGDRPTRPKTMRVPLPCLPIRCGTDTPC